MKLIAIGDTHGRTDWEQLANENNFDKMIFIGDYFDTHEDVTAEQQKVNFENIIKFKKENMNRVILLIGNHDFHYLKTANETYSGFQEWHKTDIQEMLHKALNEELMQMCYIHQKLLFTHAGVTKTWLKNNGHVAEPIDTFINNLFKENPAAFRFTKGKNRSPYGEDICQTPIWVRPSSLLADMVDGYKQVVGHTTQGQIKGIDDKLLLIDTVGQSKQYLIVEDGNIGIGVIKDKN
jgi:predicted phosphodiesterase